jgi:hypothetical protein
MRPSLSRAPKMLPPILVQTFDVDTKQVDKRVGIGFPSPLRGVTEDWAGIPGRRALASEMTTVGAIREGRRIVDVRRLRRSCRPAVRATLDPKNFARTYQGSAW